VKFAAAMLKSSDIASPKRSSKSSASTESTRASADPSLSAYMVYKISYASSALYLRLDDKNLRLAVVGVLVGVSLGACVGVSVGPCVGLSVGVADGCTVGFNVG